MASREIESTNDPIVYVLKVNEISELKNELDMRQLGQFGQFEIEIKNIKDYEILQSLNFDIVENKSIILKLNMSLFFSNDFETIIDEFMIKNITYENKKIYMSIFRPSRLSPKIRQNNNRLVYRFKAIQEEKGESVYETNEKLTKMSESLLNKLDETLIEMEKLQKIVNKKRKKIKLPFRRCKHGY